MMALLTLLATPAEACPEELGAAVQTVEQARDRRAEARRVVYGTKWRFRMATEDRDQVLAEQALAEAALRDARQAVKDARRDLSEVRVAVDVDPGACRSS